MFDDYAERTGGRDGLADISSLRTTPTSEPIVMKAQTRQELAIELLKIKAAELRKARPVLSKSQAFAKVYTDPANRRVSPDRTRRKPRAIRGAGGLLIRRRQHGQARLPSPSATTRLTP